MDDAAFADFIRAAENADLLKSILADTGSGIYAALMARLSEIADAALKLAAEAYLLALYAPEAPAEEPVEEVPAEEPSEEVPAEEPAEEAPAEVPAEEPAEEAPEAPAEDPVVDAPAENPIEEAPELPAEDPVAEAASRLSAYIADLLKTGTPGRRTGSSAIMEAEEAKLGDIAKATLSFSYNGVKQATVAIPSSLTYQGTVDMSGTTCQQYTCDSPNVEVLFYIDDIYWSTAASYASRKSAGMAPSLCSVTGGTVVLSYKVYSDGYVFNFDVATQDLSFGIMFICYDTTLPTAAQNMINSIGSGISILLPSAAAVIASGTCGDDLTWILSADGTLSIIGTGAMTSWTYDFSVPWYRYKSQITSVVLPQGITSIGDYAFSNFDNLTDISIPDSVTSIGESAFSWCSSLASISIPGSVTSIGDSAFQDCSSLTSVSIPSSITSIGDSAFSWCSSLTSISIPSSVTSIGAFAFYCCSSLTSITIPSSVTSIGASAFQSCSGLTSISIPSSVTSIGDSAFSWCYRLTSITIPDSVTSIGGSVFSSCSSLTSITIPGSVTSIGDSAFSSCSSLTSITIPGSVTSIGSSAFSDCSSLTDVHYGGSQSEREANLTIGSSNDYLLAATWHYTANTTYSGTCGSNLRWSLNTTTGKLTITGTGAMTDWSYNSSAPWHSYRSQITSVSLPSGLTSIGDYAFYNCSSLTSISIPNSVTYIGEFAFSCCSSLTSITIPDSITYIGSCAFSDCSSLTDVYYGGSRAQWNDIFIDDYNDPLTSARIHYNSSPASTAALQSFVTRLYSICLGRAPGASELSYYVSQLTAGTTTGVTVACNFVFSNEFKAKNLCNNHYITYLYRVFFDREPGASELSYHAGRLSSGAKREDIFNGFAMSNEYKALCQSYGITQGTAIGVPASGTVPTGACTVSGCTASSAPASGVNGFVTRLYSIFLNRTPGASEVSYYANLLNTHAIAGAQAAWNFFSSPEYQNRGRSSREIVIDLYKVLLGRDPAESEISYHAARFANGASKVDVFNGFAMSGEFLTICNTYGIDRGSAIPETKYRALMVGIDPNDRQPYATNDAQSIAGMLGTMTATPYSVTTKLNCTKAELLSAITAAFAGADSDDTSLFFLSAPTTTTSTGSIYCSSGTLTMAELKAALDAVPGNKIVLLNASFSGSVINKSADEDDFSEAWAQTALAIFGSSEKAGELTGSSYYVMTCCSGSQKAINFSRTDKISDVSKMHSAFAYALEMVCGWDGDSNAPLSSMSADTNRNKQITLAEAYAATSSKVTQLINDWNAHNPSSQDQITQMPTVCVNPASSGFVLFGRN